MGLNTQRRTAARQTQLGVGVDVRVLLSAEDIRRHVADLLGDPGGAPLRAAHCLGDEITHEGGVTECSYGDRCAGDELLHVTGWSCTVIDPAKLVHSCGACGRSSAGRN